MITMDSIPIFLSSWRSSHKVDLLFRQLPAQGEADPARSARQEDRFSPELHT
jgi:hypothetical protein